MLFIGGVGKSKRSQAISDDIISQKTVENVCSHPNNELSPKSDSQLRKRNKIVKKTDDKTSMVSNAHMLKSSTKGNNSSEEGATEENSQNNLKLTDDSDDWNKNQQTILEWALRQYPKGTDQRWEKISQHLPGKSKVSINISFRIKQVFVLEKLSVGNHPRCLSVSV